MLFAYVSVRRHSTDLKGHSYLLLFDWVFEEGEEGDNGIHLSPDRVQTEPAESSIDSSEGSKVVFPFHNGASWLILRRISDDFVF